MDGRGSSKMLDDSEFTDSIEAGDLHCVQQLYPTQSKGSQERAMEIAAQNDRLDIVKWLWKQEIYLINRAGIFNAFIVAINTDNFDIATWIWNHDQFGDELKITPKLADEYGDSLIYIMGADDFEASSLSAAVSWVVLDDELDETAKLQALDFLAQYDIYPDDRGIKYSIEHNQPKLLDWLCSIGYHANKQEIELAIKHNNAEILKIIDCYIICIIM
jgi:hypothetical protein